MKLSLPAQKMILAIVVSSLVFIGGGAVFYRSISALQFALGVILTSALNIWKVVMLERNIEKILSLEEKSAGKKFVQLQFLLRYLLTGLVLYAAAKTPFINLWGAIAGVFTLKIAAISMKFMKFDENANVIKLQ